MIAEKTDFFFNLKLNYMNFIKNNYIVLHN